MKQPQVMEKKDTEAFGSYTGQSTAIEEVAAEVSEVSVEEVEIPRLPLAVGLLRNMELLGMKLDYGKIAKGREGEEWYVGRSGVVQGPVTFQDILVYLVNGGGSVNAIHASDREENTAWQEFTYSPVWMQKWPARFWTAAFWGIAFMLGIVAIQVLVPQDFRKIAEIVFLVGTVAFMAHRLIRARKSEAAEPTGADESDEAA